MLLKAVKNNDIEGVKKALDNGENINTRDDDYGDTALIIASLYRYTDIVKLLLENPEKTKINVNIQDDNGNTALISASVKGYTDIVKLLLENPEKTNIDVNIKRNNFKNTALKIASYEEYTDIVRLLLESSNKTNLDVNIQDDDGNTSLIYASYFKYMEIVKLLLKHRKIKLYDVLHYTQIKEVLRRNVDYLYQPKKFKKEVKYYDKRF